MQYWLIQFMFLNLDRKRDWKQFLEPQAELIGQLANPDAFKVYYEYKKKYEAAKNASKNNDGEIKVSTGTGEYVETETDYHYDPAYGIVDKQGRLIIPKDQYEKSLGLDGVAISS